MAGGDNGATLREVHRLWDEGTVAGLSETQLLERFLARRDEVAFEALVSRHGPMVLGVCRRLLRDPHAIDDAFQATFLVLVRKARALRTPQLLGPWLYGVAYRVALRSRAVAARRSSRESPYTESASAPDDDFGSDVRPVIDEELGRLPERYRAPLVLCYLEGHTHDEAAERLRCPVGTIRSRLSRGREQLRQRLIRRGLAPAAGFLAAEVLAPRASAAVPPVLLHATVVAATRYAAGQLIAAGIVSASAAALTQGVLTTMFVSKLQVVAVGVLILGLAGGGARFAATHGAIAAQAPDRPGAAEPSKEQAAPKDDLALLQGVWQVIEVVPKNPTEAVPKNPELPIDETWGFQGSKLTICQKNLALQDKDGNPLEGSSIELFEFIQLDQQATPKRMTISAATSVPDDSQLLDTKAIYQLEGDHLRVLLSPGEALFPAHFSLQPGTSIVLKRRPPRKGETNQPPAQAVKGESARAQEPPPVPESPKPKAPSGPKDDLQRLQGVWQITEIGSETLSEKWDNWKFQGMTLTIGQRNLEDKGITKHVRLDQKATPKRMTILHPGAKEYAQATVNAIYQLEGDQLRVLMAPAGQPFPTDFSEKQKQRNISIVFKRKSPLTREEKQASLAPRAAEGVARAHLDRAKEHLQWSKAMLEKGYVSKTQVRFAELEVQLAMLAAEEAQVKSKASVTPGVAPPVAPVAPANAPPLSQPPEEPKPASLAMKELELRLKLGRMQLKRYEDLFKRQSLPLSLVQEIRLKVALLEAQLDAEKERLSAAKSGAPRPSLPPEESQSASLQELEVRRQFAQKELERFETLYQNKNVPMSIVEEMRLHVAIADAQIDSEKERLSAAKSPPDAPKTAAAPPEGPKPESRAVKALWMRLKAARKELERYEELYKRNAIPLAILEEMRSKVAVAEAEIDSEQERLSDEVELTAARLEVKRAELRVAEAELFPTKLRLTELANPLGFQHGVVQENLKFTPPVRSMPEFKQLFAAKQLEEAQRDVKKAELREVEVRMGQFQRKRDQIERLKKEVEPAK